MSEKYQGVSEEERRRRLSRVVKNLAAEDNAPVLGIELSNQERQNGTEASGQQRKKILDDVLEKKNLKKLFGQPPVFYERKENEPVEMHLEPEFAALLQAPEFKTLLAEGTDYIEKNLPFISRGSFSKKNLPRGSNIKELAEKPYDLSRVRIMTVGNQRLVVKRVDQERATNDLEEFNLAKRAVVAGIPTARPVGYLRDHGNTYLLFENLERTKDVNEFLQTEIQKNKATGWAASGLFNSLNGGYSNFSYLVNLLPRNDARWKKEKEEVTFRGMVLGQLTDNGMWSQVAQFFVHHQKEAVDIVERFRKLTDTRKSSAEKMVHETIKELTGIDLFSLKPVTIEFVAECLKKWEEAKLTKKIEDYEIETYHLAETVVRRYVPLLEREQWGASLTVPYSDFRKSVEEKSRQAGFKHADFTFLNILMKIDVSGKKPEPDEKGDAQFYVIDWEQR